MEFCFETSVFEIFEYVRDNLLSQCSNGSDFFFSFCLSRAFSLFSLTFFDLVRFVCGSSVSFPHIEAIGMSIPFYFRRQTRNGDI